MEINEIAFEEREIAEGEYTEGVVVKFRGNYYWLGEDGTAQELYTEYDWEEDANGDFIRRA